MRTAVPHVASPAPEHHECEPEQGDEVEELVAGRRFVVERHVRGGGHHHHEVGGDAIRTLRALDLPDQPGVAYLAGEARTIQRLRRILEDHLNVAAHRAQRTDAGVCDVLPIKFNLAAGRLEQSNDGFAQSGLAAA